MNFPIFAIVIIFVIWLSYEIFKHRRLEEKVADDFWKKEALANSTRKKSLDQLHYIHIPIDTLPIYTMSDNFSIQECIGTIKTLSDKKIVNLTGISNTDLKLEYGAANITVLSEYDHNFTLLVRTLYTWGKMLYESNYMEEAKQVLEFGISCRTDISSHYKILANIYIKEYHPEKIDDLIAVAQSLNSAMKNSILAALNDAKNINDILPT